MFKTDNVNYFSGSFLKFVAMTSSGTLDAMKLHPWSELHIVYHVPHRIANING